MIDKENREPKKKRVSLSLKKKTTNRFRSISTDELEAKATRTMPKNSAISSKWAVRNFNDWFKDHNGRNPGSKCPEDVLSPYCSKEILNKWLRLYVIETRNQNRDPNPPKTIYALLCGILREMRVKNHLYPNFLQKEDRDFATFHITLDNQFKSLCSDGVGSSSSQTEGISSEEEECLWSSWVLNVTTPTGLLRATFFYSGKCFCLRGGNEHQNLSVSQIQRLYDPDRYLYTEKSSKNKQGGLKQLRLEHKVLNITANKTAGERCPVFILDKYISKLPEKTKKMDMFYCRPCATLPKQESDPWFVSVAVGKNTLTNMVKTMCDEAGVDGKKLNHCLRVAGATTLFAAGVPERVIQGRTGHTSIDALRKYERVIEKQELTVSKILTGEVDLYASLPAAEPPFSDSHSSVHTVSVNHQSSESTFMKYPQLQLLHLACSTIIVLLTTIQHHQLLVIVLHLCCHTQWLTMMNIFHSKH